MALTDNMRVLSCTGDKERLEKFAAWLLRVGEGTIDHGDDMAETSQYKIELPESMCLELPEQEPCTIEALEETIQFVFPDLQTRLSRENDQTDKSSVEWFGNWIAERAILAPHNKSVDDINNVMLDMCKGNEGDARLHT